MLEILLVALFVWLFFKVIGLGFKIAWGVTKIIAFLLLSLSLPLLIVILVLAGGLFLLMPVGVVILAGVLLKSIV